MNAAGASPKQASAPRRTPHRFLFLLLAELALILGFPFTAGSDFRDHLFRLLAIIVFSTALYAVLGRGKVTVIAFLLGVPAIAIYLLNTIGWFARVQYVSQLLGVAFLAFVTGAFIYKLISDPSVTADTLAGAVSAYLLLGITYGLIYALVERAWPGSFRQTVEPGKVIPPADYLFFSFITLTTVGYGDIVPWGGHAKSIAILESVTGIMYPAVLIGRLIGLHSRPRDS